MNEAATGRHPASYRDPAGFIFRYHHHIYRAVQPVYQQDYEQLTGSGLYRELADKKIMITHAEVAGIPGYESAYKIIQPQALSFWSYPYEWSFEQLKAAALLTLRAATTGLSHDMILKDANAYNIQFVGGKPILIDSLSFERYQEGAPWQALRQFSEQFLYPLLLMSKVHGITPALFLTYPNGLPAKMVADALPWKSRFSFNNQLYLYLQASSLGNRKTQKNLKISKQKILQNLDQLSGFIRKLQPVDKDTVWNNYYQETILSDSYLRDKTEVVAGILKAYQPLRVTDIGCNTGAFSLLAAPYAKQVISLDSDAGSIDNFYREIRKQKITNIQAIVADLTNPSPAMGWMNAERTALPQRLSCDMCLALAVVHHLALTYNVPLDFISSFLAGITGQYLLIEFIPKTDPKAQLLLENKPDIFPDYTQSGFEAAFSGSFSIEQTYALKDSERTLYLLRKIS